MRLPVLSILVLAGAVRAQQPPLNFTVSPPLIKGGEEVTVTIGAFGARRLICSAFIAGADCESDEQPCGPRTAVLRMRPTVLSLGKVTIGVTACTGSQRANNPGVECWAYERNIDSGLRKAAAGAPAGPARAAAPAPAPAPSGGLDDGAAAPLLRSGAPAAPPSQARISRGWSAESADAAKPAAEAEAKPARQFRGHDGRVYTREAPAEESLAAKEEKYRKALAADPVVRGAYENWRGLDDDSRRAALQRMSDIQAEAYGIAPSKVALKPDGQPPTKIAHYNTGDRTMTINTSNPYYNSPSMQVNAISHESRHRWQHGLVERLPRLPEGEERTLAEAFKAGFENYCSVGGPRRCDYTTYRNQLIERDAFAYGEAAALHLRRRP